MPPSLCFGPQEREEDHVTDRILPEQHHRETVDSEPEATGRGHRKRKRLDVVGVAVLGLKPFRRTYSAKLLWSPLPPLWEMLPNRQQPGAKPGSDKTAPAALILPDALFEHRALVFAQDLRPIAEVVETYQKGLLAFPPPR